MTIGHAAITAELEEVKPVKTRKVLQIVCEVPMEAADAALEALGGFPIPGQSRPVAIALLNPKEIALNHTDGATAEQTAAEPERLKGGARAKRAGILCNNPTFKRWFVGSLAGRPDDTTITAMTIRDKCGVKSRADLDHNEEASRIFDRIVSDFYAFQQGRTDPEVARQFAKGPS